MNTEKEITERIESEKEGEKKREQKTKEKRERECFSFSFINSPFLYPRFPAQQKQTENLNPYLPCLKTELLLLDERNETKEN